VGGGIAGVAAATALVERGVAVTLLEQEDDLGGRLRGWHVEGGGVSATMTRGFHAFFRQYYNLRALLRRVDPSLGLLRPVADYPLRHRNGTTESFAGIPRTPPWNMAAFVRRSPTFTLADLARMHPKAAMQLFDVSVPRVYAELDGLDAVSFLDDIGFPPAARDLAFEVFSRSFFADPRDLSAAELAAMFHIYFLGSSEGLLFDVPRDPFPATLWGPLRAHVEAHGAEVRTATAVKRIDRSADEFHIHHRSGTQVADAVVLAVDVPGLQRLVDASPGLGDPQWRSQIAALRTAPPFLVTRLWLDLPAAEARPAFLGTSGFELLDNISVLDRFEEESAGWHATTGGSVVELHAYALDPARSDLRVLDTEALSGRLVSDMVRVYPELAGAEVRHAEHVLAADCPLFAPGTFARRPTVTTPDPRLALAGDLARVDLPVALMERAATTGFAAANHLLAAWGLRGHDLWSVSNQGFSPILRGLARLRRS
jgi:isorenieratene synthase